MMRLPDYLRRPSWVVFLCTTFLLSGCAGSGERLWLNAPGWSRAQLVASTQDDTAVALASAGDTTLLLTVTDNRPMISAFDDSLALLWQQTAEPAAELPTQLSIVWSAPQQTAYLFWMVDGDLYTQAISGQGEWLTAQAVLLNEGVALEQYTAVADHTGTVHVWLGGTRRDPGIYRLTVTQPTPELVAADGRTPAIFVDEANTLHAAWFVRPPGIEQLVALYYASYPDATHTDQAPQLLTETQLYADSTFLGPYMAADPTNLYIFWSEAFDASRVPGVIENQFVALPTAGSVEPVTEDIDMEIPPISTAELPYAPFEAAGFAASERVMIVEPVSGRAERLQGMQVLQTSGDEVALAFRVSRTKERNQVSQIALVYLQNGRPTSYQLITDTFYNSFYPKLATSAADLWLSWSERLDRGQFSVYLTSTNAATQEALSGIGADDIGRLSATTITGLLLNAVLTPFVFFVWIIPVFLVLLLTMPLWRKDDQLTQRGVIALVLILLTFWVVKLFTMQGMFAYVPFSQWIPVIPLWLGMILQIVVLLAVPAGAAAVAWRYGRRSDFQPVLVISIIYILLDTLGTMTFYGELLYNAF